MKMLDDWQHVKAVFEQAIAVDETDRSGFLAAACGSDALLRQRVDALLASHAASQSFLEVGASSILQLRRSAEDLSGQRLGTYQLQSRIGAGAMGEVYLAHDEKLNRSVAVKLIAKALAGDPDRLRRFRQEAQAASSLNHPNIVVVHDFGELDDRPFIVTELVEGVTLRERLKDGPLPIRDAIEIVLQMTSALAAAHARGLVHRDIKPENVMLRPDGYVKVVDFGLAKLARAEPMGGTASTCVTQPGQAAGTPSYMSPEQARAELVDARTDVFSVGAVLYEIITGRLAFSGESPAVIFAGILAGTPPAATAINPNVPPELERLIIKALEKDRDLRYQSVADMRADLLRLRRESDVGRLAPSTNAAVSAGSRVSESSSATSRASRPDVRFCSTADGASIAYCVDGTGPVLVRVLGHFTHVDMEWEWPALRRLWEALAVTHTVVRYDGRGIGMSAPWEREFTEETRQLDLDAVLDALKVESSILLGISEGGWTAAVYANAHRERISQLILLGAYARGALARPGFDQDEDAAILTLMRKGWGRDTPAFRQIFTSRFFPGRADPGLLAHFNELQRVSADPDTAARYMASLHRRGDGRDIYMSVRIPTLVMHGRDDQMVTFDEGRLLATLIPGAKLITLPTGNHYFPTDQNVVAHVVDAINRFA
jgi:serine/threonine protein kinase/alpha-beta hydrolase superfamily lysophospholipase